jgi:peptidoglycan hydrolase-like protein with peptidoglycan-binding domain
MPPPEAHVTLHLPVLKEGGDPALTQEVMCLQFMLLFRSGAYSPFERVLRRSDGVDGIFGPKTKQWVRNFQGNSNLAVDGIVGTNTWTALLNDWVSFQTAG